MKLWLKISVLALVGFGVGFSAIYFFKNADSSTNFSSAKNSGKPIELGWDLLRELDVDSGKAPSKLKEADGALVKVPGFIVPLEDSQTSVREFLLVPYPQACIHVPSPPPNQIVYVKMASGNKAAMSYGPIWAQGRFRISEKNSMYGKASFELIGELIEPFQ